MFKTKLFILIVSLFVSTPAIAADAGTPATKATATSAPTKSATPTPVTVPAGQPALKTTDAKPAAETVPKPEVKSEPTSEKQSFWQGILLTILQAVFAVASPILVVLLGGLLRKMKLNVDKEKLEWAVGKAVGFGEQKLRSALKDGKDPDYAGVKKQAVELGDKLLLKQGLAKKWGGMLGDLIEGKLGQSKLDGAEAPKPDKPVS